MMRRPGATVQTLEAQLVKIVPSAKRKFQAPNGRDWEADFCLHSGDNQQSPHLMVIFRDPVRVEPERYNLLPPGSPRFPKQAAKQITDDQLRALLQRSVPLNRV
jgi:hypothetical protein